MNKELAVERLDNLIVKYLRVPSDHQLRDSDEVSGFAAEWRIVDLAIVVEAEFGIPMSADKALTLRTIGDWRDLVRAGSTER